jgi:hypothetical protein
MKKITKIGIGRGKKRYKKCDSSKCTCALAVTFYFNRFSFVFFFWPIFYSSNFDQKSRVHWIFNKVLAIFDLIVY